MKFIDSEKPVSLYIHIPFCSRKCSYCAFYSLPKSRWPMEPDEYGEVVLKRIEELSDITFSSIYLGGGNPGLLSDEMIIRIISAVKKDENAEITVEMNPEEVSTKRIETLKPYITRISIGIQSLNQKTLSTLGRNSNREENLKALKILKESSINFNADLITAVPGESIEDVISDIRELSAFTPDHISFYCLSFEEGTPLYSMRGKRDEDFEYEALMRGWDELRRLGYEHYEISNFAREKRYSRHNINYWRLGQYIGIGPASESSLGYYKVASYHENEDVNAFIQSEKSSFEELSRTEGALEYLMVSLRTKWGLDKKELLERFEIDFDSTFTSVLKELDKDCYLNTENNFSLTEKGWMILDSIILSLSMAF